MAKIVLKDKELAGAKQLLASMNKAKAKGINRPKIRLGEYLFAMAPDTGRNPGLIYITENDCYIGKLTSNSAELVTYYEDRIASILEVLEDVTGAATAYGQRTGKCCICGRLLTAKESIAHSIGPVCAEKFGFSFPSIANNNKDMEIPDDF